mgnify:CR=1 FL=1
MKKLFVAAVALLITAGAINAQNTFRGIVKYKIESTGQVAMQIPEGQNTTEIKVYDQKLKMGESLQNGLKMAQPIDLSQAIAYFAANDIELESYTGDGKLLVRTSSTKESLDSMTIKDTEPGHYYYEYAADTKDILGYTAKKVIIHKYNEEGVDQPTECWYTDQIGPEYNMFFEGLKGMPLIFTQPQGEGKEITLTAVEIVKGKVKESEMLLPAGYKDTTPEEFQSIMKEIQQAAELLED